MRKLGKIVVMAAITALTIGMQNAPASAQPSFSGTATDDPLVPEEAALYDAGLGACGAAGRENPVPDPLTAPEVTVGFGVTDNGESPCGKDAVVTLVDTTGLRATKSVTVRVVDRCGGCSGDDIDLSPAAFGQLTSSGSGAAATRSDAPPGEGRVKVSWKFV